MDDPILDPVHGAVYPDRLERLIIQSAPLQRLKGIRQLGLVDVAYPGAIHSRFEHSVGTMHVAGLMAVHLGLSPDEVRRVRIAGLLHDIGHSALSHAVEQILARNPDLQPEVNGKKAVGHEQFTRALVQAAPFGPQVEEAVRKDFGDPASFFGDVAEIINGRSPPLGQIVSGDVDADRIDFLLRDSHHCGVNLGLVDLDQILQALTIQDRRVILSGDGDYRADLSITAAESILVARAHHYNALVHHPQVQSARSMLLYVMESVLKDMEAEAARSQIRSFFTEYIDSDLTNLLAQKARDDLAVVLGRLREGRTYPLASRFDHRTLPPGIRMAISTIARNGRARRIFERSLGRQHGVLVDISTGSGVPKSLRTGDGFLYDESVLAAGLIKSLTRQLTLSIFSDDQIQISQREIGDLSARLLTFIRSESYLPIEGILLFFHELHGLLSETFSERILVPRVRNITWLYRAIQDLRNNDGKKGLSGLFDYPFHLNYGFPYSERLFEDIQILVAMGMVYQDQRQFSKAGRWHQRYEYMLTSEGLDYAGEIARQYGGEAAEVRDYLRKVKHTIPYDMVSLLLSRYRSKPL